MRLLIIEDHAPLARVLRKALEEEGCTVEIVGTPESAEARLRPCAFDAVLLDLVRCQGRGHALLQRWCHAGLRTPVLALTEPGLANLCVPGADDALSVPFAFEELLARLRRCVNGVAGTVLECRLQPAK